LGRRGQPTSDKGVDKTINTGEEWFRTGLTDQNISVVAIDLNDPRVV
jgi:hypothetical protein